MIPSVGKEFTEAKRLLFDKLYRRLNDEQRRALYTVKGPLLVLAGAGSGKTTVLVNRISHIVSFGDLYMDENAPADAEALLPAFRGALKNGNDDEIRALLSSLEHERVSPYEVLCITFTNKAATEFKERLFALLGDRASQLWMGTFHSVCVRILRRHADLLGYSKSFTIYDDDDSRRLITAIMKRLKLEDEALSARAVHDGISRAKEKCVEWREYENEAAGDARLEVIAEVYKEYAKELKDASALDFDDIILLTLKLFHENKDVLLKYQRQFKYILVDEYQDTNLSQSRLVNLLGELHRNVCVVGDDDQSIYAFRGATVENILGFDKVYKDCVTVRLEQNYRSTQTILDAANAIISNNVSRKGKNLWTAMGEGERILLKKQFTQSGEAGYIVKYIKEQVAEGNASYRDFAVLYRLNAQANALEIVFSKSRVPYRVFGGTRFYERKEIKDLVSYLAVISNPSDDVRLKRIINMPKRGIGSTTTQLLFDIAEEQGISIYEVLEKMDDHPELGKGAARLKVFYELMEELRGYAKNAAVSDVVRHLIEKTGYREMLEASDEAEKAQLMDELISSAVAFEEQADEPTVDMFLADIALITDIDNYDEDADAVTLMTVHSAKGLEFSTVFLPGFEEGIFPGEQSCLSESALEEERRLAYVAVTRAKKQLIITHTNTRLLYGQTKRNQLSRFVAEIPKSLVRIEQPVKTVYSNVSEAKRRYISSQESFVKNTLAQPEEKPRPKGASLLREGDRVEHRVFGAGTVKKAREMGGDALYEIDFDSVGEKKLMASFAKLKKL